MSKKTAFNEWFPIIPKISLLQYKASYMQTQHVDLDSPGTPAVHFVRSRVPSAFFSGFAQNPNAKVEEDSLILEVDVNE